MDGNVLNNVVVDGGLNVVDDNVSNDVVDGGLNVVVDNKNNNNWNTINDDVLRKWKTSLLGSIYIYQYVLDKTQTNLNRILFAMKTLSALCVMLSSILIALTGKDPNGNVVNNNTFVLLSFTSTQIITIIFNGLIIIMCCISVVLGHLNTIYKMDTNISLYSAYINNMDQVYSSIATQLLLPYNLRTDAIKFITDMNVTYTDLIKKSPNVEIADQEDAMKQYDKYVDGKIKNYNYSQKYSKDDNVISVI